MPDDLSSAWPPRDLAQRPTAPPVQPVPTRWRYQPVSSALWRALSMDAPTLAATLASESATRLDVLAARAVDLACSGNIKAIGLIAERIEGRVGLRPGEVAPEDEARREDMQAVIEFVVTAMVNAKIAGADDLSEDSASDRTAVVIDAEAPRRLGDDAPEPGRRAQMCADDAIGGNDEYVHRGLYAARLRYEERGEILTDQIGKGTVTCA